jgi:hypothetical protein
MFALHFEELFQLSAPNCKATAESFANPRSRSKHHSHSPKSSASVDTRSGGLRSKKERRPPQW